MRNIRVTVPNPRPVTQDELDGWLEAAGQRTPPRDRDLKTMRAWLKKRNIWKYNQLERLMRWAEKEYFKEFGLYPEDARWLLP